MRILIVEDDDKLSAVLRQGLEEEGHGVDVCGTAECAQEWTEAVEYDAVLLDLMLPRRSGLALLRSLRGRGSRAPVLVLSALSTVEDRVKGLDLGADDYLVKPFAFRELLARLRAITRRPPTEPRVVLRAADLELDTVRHEVRRAGHRVQLTAREFALLEYLLRKKGLVVTRSMILDHVWGLDYHGSSNLVEVYVNYLRHKVDQADPKLIHTVRGVGYSLREPK